MGGLEVPLLIWEVATAYLVGGLEVPLLIWEVATAYLEDESKNKTNLSQRWSWG